MHVESVTAQSPPVGIVPTGIDIIYKTTYPYIKHTAASYFFQSSCPLKGGWTLNVVCQSCNFDPFRVRCYVSLSSSTEHQMVGTPIGLILVAWIEAFTTGSPHTNTIVITAEIESGFVAKDDLVPFHCNPVSSCAAPLQTEASMGGRLKSSTRNERRNPKCPSARRLRMVREDTEAPNEGATYVKMAVCVHF
ncbi:hypothetical protein TNCV_3787721 [Trichonephila clavipes]|nr:hypothetical protein TNCV_3787721 [Trichonephila clavipes]